MDNTILSVQKVTKKYKNQTVLDNVDLSINKSEIVGLVGPNGSGKTTIMGIIVGLIKNYEGNVLINGENIRTHKKGKAKQVGCVIEAPGFYPNMTGYENLKFFSHVFGGIKSSEIDEMVKLLGLENSIHKKVKNYSLGMKQRLGIGQAVLGYPSLLILDEPTNGLDPNIIPSIRQFIKYMAREKGLSVLISSHILTEIEAICDKVVFIKNGKVIEELHIDSKEVEDSIPYVFETEKAEQLQSFLKAKSINCSIENGENVIAFLPPNEIEKVISQIIQQGIALRGMYKQKISLEDRFIKSIGENTIE
ncbi:MAG TPA: ABC transporter ATP-binding protein [Pseudobacteroides sp.]|uniref:ABC transporter ATP-binding protein n=1 Tax=Pseudobacteroides sp. TaxID=1968840 RepID=UPI002F94C31A